MHVNQMFCCDKCGNFDSLKATEQNGGNMFQCHRCLHGWWHGYFPEEQYDSFEHEACNRSNAEYKGFGSPSFG